MKRIVPAQTIRLAMLAGALALPMGLMLPQFSTSALAQAMNDDLAPPADLDAGDVPVPDDTTDIGDHVPPPATAIPAVAHRCGELSALVKNQGEALVTVPDGYDMRFVREQSFCKQEQVLKPAWTATPDDPHCFVGYSCEDPAD
ncbi:hypothetical protein ACT6QH_10745 [Xanthobacter sp. TB0139]|uniref:hypothetical protein n=1 Tax=Xanthobacter sp. TB0139 TaxID=3459178 RepID=UPI0040398062